jgi:hypothetical protein
MSIPGTFQSRRQSRRIEEQVHKPPLIVDREPDEMRFLDRTVRRFLGRGNDKVADATSLKLSGTFHHGQRLGSNPSLKTRASVRFSWHHGNPPGRARLYGILPDNSRLSVDLPAQR